MYGRRCTLDLISASASASRERDTIPHADKLRFPVNHTGKVWAREKQPIVGLPTCQRELLH